MQTVIGHTTTESMEREEGSSIHAVLGRGGGGVMYTAHGDKQSQAEQQEVGPDKEPTSLIGVNRGSYYNSIITL